MSQVCPYITIEDVFSYDPCWSRDRVLRVAGGRRQVRLTDVPTLYLADRDSCWLLTMWLVQNNRGLLATIREKCYENFEPWTYSDWIAVAINELQVYYEC